MRFGRKSLSIILLIIGTLCLVLGWVGLGAHTSDPSSRPSNPAPVAAVPTPDPDLQKAHLVSNVPLAPFKEVEGSLVRAVEAGRSPAEIEKLTGLKVSTAREVTLDRKTFDELKPGQKTKLRLHLFEDTEVVLDVVVSEASFIKGVGLSGKIDGDETSTASLSYAKGILVGTISQGSKHYQIQDSGDRTHFVVEIDPTRYPQSTESDTLKPAAGSPIDQKTAGNSTETSGATAPSGPSTATTAGAATDVIRLVVLYTPEAARRAGSVTGLLGEINTEVSNLNESLISSGVTGGVLLVAAEQTSYEQDLSRQDYDLKRIADGGDGFADEAATLKNQYEADYVLLYTATFTNFCGIAFYGNGDVYHGPKWAYGVAARNCSFKWTLAHEIGHGLGADHDPDFASTESPAYARGWVGPATTLPQYQDVMAYDDKCKPNCLRHKVFSNQVATIAGRPMGSPLHDNARRINETIGGTSRYMDKPPIIPGIAQRAPGTPVTFTARPPAGVVVQSVKWYKSDGQPWVVVPGQTTSTLTVVTPAENKFMDYYAEYLSEDGVYYTSWVARSAGITYTNFSLASWDSSTLTTVEGQPTTVSVAINAPFAAVTYEWTINGVLIAGQNGPSVTFTPTRNNTQIQVSVGNSTGKLVLARNLNVQYPPTFTTQPLATASPLEGSSLNVNSAAVGNPGITAYRWQKDGVNLTGQTLPVLSLTSLKLSDSGTYRVIATNSIGNTASSSMVLTVRANPPVITTQPVASLAVVVGQNTQLSVVATSSTPLTYQWTFNDSAILGATSATLTLNNVQQSNEGLYRVAVTNQGGTTLSSRTSLIIRQPPVITTQPLSQAINQGSNATFSVVATGDPAPTYSWRYNGTPIAGGTLSTLRLTQLLPSQAGTYSVDVRNVVGSTMSSNAILSVNIPPTITTQPQPVSVNEGGNATFSVTATGTAPITYQWRLAGVPIMGATNATLQLNNVARNQAGNYSVVVTNVVSSVTSNNAALNVLFAPTFTTQPMASAVQAGENVTLTSATTANPAATYKWFWVNPITGVTSEVNAAPIATLPLTPITFAQRGEYFVRATNSVGSVDSNKALVNVLAIDREPASTGGFMNKPEVKVDRTGGF